jgi:hypothetical protein
MTLHDRVGDDPRLETASIDELGRGGGSRPARLSKLSKGTLRFTVKATKIGSGHPKVTLTTQVRQSRTG